MFQAFHEQQGAALQDWYDVSYEKEFGYENEPNYKGMYEIQDILRWREIDPIRFVDKDKKVHSFHNHKLRMGRERKTLDIFAKVMRMHPNETGHSLWAEYLCEYINKNKLIRKLI
jgi:hypothetical protein